MKPFEDPLYCLSWASGYCNNTNGYIRKKKSVVGVENSATNVKTGGSGCNLLCSSLWMHRQSVIGLPTTFDVGKRLVRPTARLTDYTKRNNIERIYHMINLDNEASMKLHQKVGFNVKSWKVASYRRGELAWLVKLHCLLKSIFGKMLT